MSSFCPVDVQFLSGGCPAFVASFYRFSSKGVLLLTRNSGMSSKTKTILFIVLLALLLMIAVWLFFDWRIQRLIKHPEQTTSMGKQPWMDLDGVRLQSGIDT